MEREQEEQVQPASTYTSDWAGTVDQGAGEVGSSAVNFFNPFSPESDQHQVSPNNIHTLSREMVTRIN